MKKLLNFYLPYFLSLCLLLTAGFFWYSQIVQAAVVAYGGSNISPTKGTAASLTTGNFTISGSNLVIVIGIAYDDAPTGRTVSSASWSLGSGTAVEIKATKSSGAIYSTVWCIPAPTAGTGTVNVTLTNSLTNAWVFNAAYFTGADQTTPCPTGDAVGDVSGGPTYTMTPNHLTANDANFTTAVDANGSVNSLSPNQLHVDNTEAAGIGTGYNTGTGSVTVTDSDTNTSFHANTAVRIAAVSSASGAATHGLTVKFIGKTTIKLTGNVTDKFR